jgi:hypothetical protein
MGIEGALLPHADNPVRRRATPRVSQFGHITYRVYNADPERAIDKMRQINHPERWDFGLLV